MSGSNAQGACRTALKSWPAPVYRASTRRLDGNSSIVSRYYSNSLSVRFPHSSCTAALRQGPAKRRTIPASGPHSRLVLPRPVAKNHPCLTKTLRSKAGRFAYSVRLFVFRSLG